ncbi:MAG: NlpC/P60 family protein [Thermodesulfobacteriota bacterium]
MRLSRTTKPHLFPRVFPYGATIFLSILILLSSCTLIPVKPGAPGIPSSLGNDPGRIKSQLYTQYDTWQNVGYRHGGMSRNGVDCSGFVHITYRDRFGITLPRSTSQMSKEGIQIMQRDLIAGDLVFFKTGTFTKHVGIYLEKGKFLHASTEKGVTISSLGNTYWQRCYWQARRI